MGRKKKQQSKEDQIRDEVSFDTDAILYLAALQYNIRQAIIDKMVEKSENKKCIPVSVAKIVVKEMGLKQYEDEV